MKRREWLIAAGSLLAFMALRGRDALTGPFILPFETAFQEALALRRPFFGFPVIADFSGRVFYHTAHPPLLIKLYEVMFLIANPRTGEHLTRFFSLALFFGAVLFWRSLLGRGEKHGWMIFPPAFFLPGSFLLGTTTNYEPLSIFMISWIAWIVIKQRSREELIIAVVIGLLVDWPVYLAVPALMVVKWRDRKTRRRLFFLLGFEAVFFTALQVLMYVAAGENVFWGHAPERANPPALLRSLPELWSHYYELCGPVALVCAAAVIGLAVFLVRRPAKAEDGDDAGAREAGGFFLVLPVLLLVTAPGLTSRHYVYLLYFTPLLALALVHALKGSGAPRMALLALLVLLLTRDYVLSRHRNPSYFAMAVTVKDAGIETAFASSAVGAWRYYAGIETAFPVSAAMSEWAASHDPDLVHLDLRHGEVAEDIERMGKESRGYRLLFSIPGERIYIKRDLGRGLPRYLMSQGPSEGSDWREPSSVFIMADRGPACTVKTCTVLGGKACAGYEHHPLEHCQFPAYALRQHPGPAGSALSSTIEPGANTLSLRPAIVHALPGVRSDGVSFLAVKVYYDKESGETRLGLGYARFVGDRVGGGSQASRPAEINIAGAAEVALVTLPGPALNSSFDDACWLEPVFGDGAGKAGPSEAEHTGD